jgi:hypothetical protein
MSRKALLGESAGGIQDLTWIFEVATVCSPQRLLVWRLEQDYFMVDFLSEEIELDLEPRIVRRHPINVIEGPEAFDLSLGPVVLNEKNHRLFTLILSNEAIASPSTLLQDALASSDSSNMLELTTDLNLNQPPGKLNDDVNRAIAMTRVFAPVDNGGSRKESA